MSSPLRVLLLGSRQYESGWRCSFDLLQAAAALDIPMQVAVAGPALEWILPPSASTASRAFSSLALLGIEPLLSLGPCPIYLSAREPVLPLRWIEAAQWRAWLRQASLQVW